eukprot:3446948-Rhodomonas_salina.3
MGAEQAKEDQRPTSVPNPDQARLIAKLDCLYAKIGKCECRLVRTEMSLQLSLRWLSPRPEFVLCFARMRTHVQDRDV